LAGRKLYMGREGTRRVKGPPCAGRKSPGTESKTPKEEPDMLREEGCLKERKKLSGKKGVAKKGGF